MKRFLTWILSLILLTGLTRLPAQEPAAKANRPLAQLKETSLDFGKVKPTDTLHHDFVIANVGTAVLLITNVQPGCGCTTAEKWDREVPPGKTGIIPIQFNPANFGGLVS